MKKGFTMLELVFIIVVIGILAAVMIPRMNRDNVAEATIDLQSKINYTKHLALIDDQYDRNNATWFRNRWRVDFGGDTVSIWSGSRAAQDTQTHLPIKVDYNKKYGVNIALQNDCAGVTSIAFDHVGRVLLGNITTSTQPYVKAQILRADQNCIIVVKDANSDSNASLRLHGESGFLEACPCI